MVVIQVIILDHSLCDCIFLLFCIMLQCKQEEKSRCHALLSVNDLKLTEHCGDRRLQIDNDAEELAVGLARQQVLHIIHEPGCFLLRIPCIIPLVNRDHKL